MSQVYITKFTFGKISQGLQNHLKNKTREFYIHDIIKDFEPFNLSFENMNNIFNTRELKQLYTDKKILLDFIKLLEEAKINKSFLENFIENENKKYAYKVDMPKYHSDNSCKWLLSDFYNVEIPKSCISDDKIRESVQQWIVENKKRMPFNELNQLFKERFNCPDGLREITKNNSGVESIHNESNSIAVLQKIHKKNKQLQFFFDQDFAEEIMRYRYADSWKFGAKNKRIPKEVIDFHTVKTELKNLLIDFYISRYNQDLSFDKKIIEEIGILGCKACSN